MCLHMTGLDERFCGYCVEAKGVLIGTARVKAEKHAERTAIKDLEKSLDEISRLSDNFGEDWTEDEVQILFSIMDGAKSYRETRKTMRKAAKELQRTIKSVWWHYKHLFVIPNDPKAGKNLLKFKQEKGLLA